MLRETIVLRTVLYLNCCVHKKASLLYGSFPSDTNGKVPGFKMNYFSTP